MLDSVVNPLPPLSTEQVSIFESVCKKLAFKFRPDMFCNPSLQSFYTNLEALVYDESANEIEDLTLPEYSVQDPKIEPFLQEIEEEFGTVRFGTLMDSFPNVVYYCRRKPLL